MSRTPEQEEFVQRIRRERELTATPVSRKKRVKKKTRGIMSKLSTWIILTLIPVGLIFAVLATSFVQMKSMIETNILLAEEGLIEASEAQGLPYYVNANLPTVIIVMLIIAILLVGTVALIHTLTIGRRNVETEEE